MAASENQFTVIDPWGEQVDVYPTEDAAKQDIERCQKEDAMWNSAQLLVDTAIHPCKCTGLIVKQRDIGLAARQRLWTE